MSSVSGKIQEKTEEQGVDQQTVHQVKYTADPRDHMSGIFHLTRPFERGFRQVARHTSEEENEPGDRREPYGHIKFAKITEQIT